MSSVDRQILDPVQEANGSSSRIKTKNTAILETDFMRLLSPSALLAQMTRNTATDVSNHENDGLVGIAPPTWKNIQKFDDSYSTSSSGTHNTRITANHNNMLTQNYLLDVANSDEYMDLSNPTDDLLNVSLNLVEDFDDCREDSSITLTSNDGVLPSKGNTFSALDTILSGEEGDARYEHQASTHSSSNSSCYKSESEIDDYSKTNYSRDYGSPSSSSTVPKDSFGLPLLPFSHELFQKIRIRRKIVDQQLKEQEENANQLQMNMEKRAIVPHASSRVDLTIHEEKKEEEPTIEVHPDIQHWIEKLTMELKSGNSESSAIQFPGKRTKGRTTDKDASNQPRLPIRQETDCFEQNGQSESSWIILDASSRKLMMIRSREAPILSFFGVSPSLSSPRDTCIYQQLDVNGKHYGVERPTTEQLERKRCTDRNRTWSQDLIDNRYYEVRARALFQLEESKQRLKEHRSELI